jgi:hypothetical protein
MLSITTLPKSTAPNGSTDTSAALNPCKVSDAKSRDRQHRLVRTPRPWRKIRPGARDRAFDLLNKSCFHHFEVLLADGFAPEDSPVPVPTAEVRNPGSGKLVENRRSDAGSGRDPIRFDYSNFIRPACNLYRASTACILHPSFPEEMDRLSRFQLTMRAK